MNKKNHTIKWRAYFVFSGITVFVLILISRLYVVQVIYGEHYAQRADMQYLVPTSQIFDRGNIYFTFRDGQQVAAAALKTGYKIILNPSIIVNPESVFNNLSMDIDIDPEDFLHKISNSTSRHSELVKRVNREVAEKIIAKELIGVNLYSEKWRFYPGNELASHLTGFVAFRGDELRGQYGLERQYEDILNRDGDNIFKNFFVEIFSNIKDILIDGKDMKGSIVTTVEPNVQAFLEKELELLFHKHQAKLAGGIIMNPQDGAIYSMGLYPNFDLNTFNLVDNVEIYQNHLVESVYEFGSIIKPLTIAIGLDTKKITPETTYEDKGSRTLNGRTFHNHDLKTHGVVNMQQVLNQSLNLGVSNIVDRVGQEVFATYMKRIFDGITSIDLPNEQASLISNLDSRNNIEYATASFGQGIAMTPISVIRGLATLGNGGYLVQPHLVKRINYRSGLGKAVDYKKGERIFTAETSETISRMLVNTVDEALLGGTVSIDNFNVAAKTGTAQIAKRGDSGYYSDRYLHSFFGYFPAYEPEFIILLYVIEPQNSNYASQTLTTPFMNITKFLINYYEIMPDRAVVKGDPNAQNGQNEHNGQNGQNDPEYDI